MEPAGSGQARGGLEGTVECLHGSLADRDHLCGYTPAVVAVAVILASFINNDSALRERKRGTLFLASFSQIVN